MTVADLLVGLVCMPIRALIFAFDRTWMLGGTFCYIFIGVQNALPGVSVFGVVVICFDRFLATSYPLHHYRWKTKKTAVVVNALTWLIPCSIWLSISTFWDLARPSGAVTRSGWCDPNYSRYFISSTITVLLRACIPFVTIAILSVQIYRRAKSAGQKRLGGRSIRSMPATKRDDKFSVSQDQIMYEAEAKSPERSTDTPSSNVEAEHVNSGKKEKTSTHQLSLPRVTEDKISTKVGTNEVKQNIPSIYGQEIIARRQKEKVAPTDADVCGTSERDRPNSDEKSGSVLGSPPVGAHTSFCTVPKNRCSALSFADESHSYRVPISLNSSGRSSVTSPKPRPGPFLEGITTAKSQGEKRISDGSKALRTLAFLVVTFYLTWFLNTLNIILRTAAPEWSTSLPSAVQIRESGRWLSYCNSTLNPLAYTLAQPLLRRTIRKMFCKDN
ncbi:histamine H1 receptor-like [Diadema antillarum]|uniref:histamine H1 receptor-like n=1 Tax=Diadema antillarum TaxID=105358 RepID=UPI003A85C492